MSYRICRDGLGRYVVQRLQQGEWVDCHFWDGEANHLVRFRWRRSALRWIDRQQQGHAWADKAAERNPITRPPRRADG